MTTRIPGPSARPTGGAPSLVEPQSKDDALLKLWFPKLGKDARDLFSTQWKQTGLPLGGNYEAAKKLHDKLFAKGATAKTSVRPRSLSATMPSGSGRKPKSLKERAIHVPNPLAQAPAPAPQAEPEIYIDLTDFLASTATEVKTDEAPAMLEAKSAMRPEDEALCKELDKALEDWTQRFKAAKPAPRQRPTPSFREEFMEHCEHLRQIYKICLVGAEDQHPLLREHINAHISDLLAVVGQGENFWDLETIATSAKELRQYYPNAAPRVDLGRRLAETFRQLVVRSDGSRRGILFEDGLIPALTKAIIASDISSAQALLTTAFQYHHYDALLGLLGPLEKADGTRYSFKKCLECFVNSLEQTVQRICNLSMRGSDREAVELFKTAAETASFFELSSAVAGRVLEAYQALSRRAKYLALQDLDLKRHLVLDLLQELPSTEKADAVRKEIEDFDPHLFALPEVSTGSDILTIIKKLEEAFANLPESLSGNVGALLHSHIREFLENASASSETPDERGARREILLGALNYAFAIHGAIASLVGLLSADEVRTVTSWFDGDLSVRILGSPITKALKERLKALGARDDDW
jgi:hypothetical protein